MGDVPRVDLPREPPKTNPSPLAEKIMATSQSQQDMIRQMGGSTEMAAASNALTDRALAASTKPLTTVATDRVLTNPGADQRAAAATAALTKPKPLTAIAQDRSAQRLRRIQGQLALRGLGTVIRG